MTDPSDEEIPASHSATAKQLPAAGRKLHADEVGLLDILLVLAERARLLVLGPIVFGLLVLGATYLITPMYTARSQILPPQQQQSIAVSMLQSLGALGGLAGAAAGLKNPADQYVALLQSASIESALVERFKLKERYGDEYLQDARKHLEKHSDIALDKNNIISISFDDKDPEFAANVANAYVEELARLMDRLAVTEAQQRRAFFEKQLANTSELLTKAQQTLAASGVSVSAINSNPSAAIEGPARLRAELVAQQVKLASMRTYLTETSPEYQLASAQADALREQLEDVDKQQPNGKAENSDYIAKFREYKYQEALFELFSKQYEIAKVDESREGAVIQVVDVARAPEKKSKPKRVLIAVVSSIVSGFLLLIYVLVRSALVRELADSESRQKIASIKAHLKAARPGR